MPLCRGEGPETIRTFFLLFANKSSICGTETQSYKWNIEYNDYFKIKVVSHLYYKVLIWIQVEVELEIHKTTCELVSLFNEEQNLFFIYLSVL